MRLKSLTTLALLFVISFSIIHEFVYAAHDNDHCSAIEYVSEFETPQAHESLCDIHCVYHQLFLLSQNSFFQNVDFKPKPNIINKETYSFKTLSNLYRPPIS